MKLSKSLVLAINTYMAVKWINDGWFLGKPSPSGPILPDGRIIKRDEKGIAALKSMLSVL